MRVRVLGPTSLEAHGTVSGRDAKVLAALAAGFPDPVPADVLADTLWPDGPPPSRAKVIQGAISRLRAIGGSAWIATEPGGYRLAVDPGDIDAREFEGLVDHAALVLASDPVAAVVALDAAEALWHGEPFADLGGAMIATGAVSHVEARRRVAGNLRIEALLASGRPDDAVAAARGQSGADPYDERRTALLVTALYRSGRAADALAVLHDVRGRLRDDLGLEPGPELAALELAVLRHDDIAPPPAAGGEAGRSTFVGRASETAALVAALQPGAQVTLVGPGGIGKTRLASVAASAAGREREVVVVELAEVTGDDGQVAGAVVSRLGAGAPGIDAVGALRQAVAGRSLLLVLDNCEHVLPQVRALVDVVRTAPDLVILATSREPLAGPGETVVRLGGLGEDGPELFAQRALGRGCPPDAARGEDARVLCERLGGLPLAIELAASRTGALTPGEILDRLDREPGLLSEAGGSGPERHRSLAAVFDWSLALLGPAERTVLAHLALFPGGAVLDTLDHTCGAEVEEGVATAVSGLVDASLVEVGRDPTGASRYRIHEALRATAAQRLGDGAAPVQRLLAWASAWSERLDAGLQSPDERTWRAGATAERANLGRAIQEALVAGETGIAARICLAYRDHAVYGLDAGALGWFRAVARSCVEAGAPEAGRVLVDQAMLEWLAGDKAAAIAATVAAESAPGMDVEVRAQARHIRGLATNDAELLRAAVEDADRTGVVHGSVAFRLPLVMSLPAGDVAEAVAAEAWELARSSGHPSTIASAHLSAAVALARRAPDEAGRHFEMCRVIAVDVGNRMLATIVDVLAGPSLAAAVAAAARLRDQGVRVQAGMALLRAADALAALGDRATAATLVDAAGSTGLGDWQAWRRPLRLSHLDPRDPGERSPFAPVAPDLDAAIALAEAALARDT